MDIDEIKALLDGVTPGPWGQREVDPMVIVTSEELDDEPWEVAVVSKFCGYDVDRSPANARFIAASREIVPALLDRVQELESALSEPVAMILHIADALRENAITLMSAEGDNFGASILGYADRITAAQKEKHHD